MAYRGLVPGFIVIGILAVGPHSFGHAQSEPSPSQVAAARQQYRAGMRAVEEERWDDAREAFEKSYALVQRPLILFNLAGAQMKAGLLIEAAESYRRFLRELGDGPERKVEDEARRTLDELVPRIPSLTLEVTGLSEIDRIELDGEPLPADAATVPFPVNPGTRTVVISRDGEEIVREDVSLAEHEERTLPLTLPRRQEPATTEARVSASLVGGNASPNKDEGGGVARSPWLWLAIGAVVAGGVTTAVLLSSGGGGAEDPFVGNLPPGGWEL